MGSLANSEDPDEMQHDAAFHQGLHCLLSFKTTYSDRKYIIAPDKDWRQLGIYPPLFGLIGYFKI